MKIDTRDFGQVEIDEVETIEFCAPIYGFEHTRRFVILTDKTLGNMFLWLQSLDDAQVRFILVDPNVASPGYRPQIADSVRDLLELDPEQEPLFLVIAVIPQEFSKTTVNLKSPIIINSRKRRAAQVILDEDYPVREPLIKSGGGGQC